MPKIVNHEEEKKKIALKALDLFRQESYFNVGMRDLAKALNISKTKIYHYFESKNELIEYSFTLLKNVAIGFKYDDQRKASVENIVDYYSTVLDEYRFELFLLVDYLRDKQLDKKKSMEMSSHYKMSIIEEIGKYLKIDSDTSKMIHLVLLGAIHTSALSDEELPKKQVKEIINILLQEKAKKI